MNTLEGKKAVVCGSTQGIGHACAVELARQGAAVTLMARHQGALNKVRDELPADHGQTHDSILADFTDAPAVGQAAADYAQQNGPIHILLNNTGGPPAGPLIEAAPEDLMRGFQMHIICNQMLVQAFAPGMREAGYGRIINIISTSVVQPIKGLGVSNTIRGAMGNWARTLSSELAPFGITVNSILPGYTDTVRLGSLIEGKAKRAGSTPQEIVAQWKAGIPMGRFGSPHEIGAVAAFLASPAASYVNGVNLPVDGGRLAAQ